MSSSSISSGQSTSTPEILPFLQQLAQFSQGLASQTYDWAGQQFQKNSQLTDANVQSYLATSASALAQAQNDTTRYDTLFQPQENNLVQDANTYASTNRIQSDMGSAEAGVAQSMDAGRQNTERDLQAFGIDPSSGRYDELEQASQAQKGAAQAGAAQQAERADEATGRSLRSEAIQVGERYPGQIINSLNTAMQGFGGAENAELSNTNTGANAFGTAAQFVKFPPVSNASQSTQNSASGSNSPQNGSGSKSPSSPAASSKPGSNSGNNGNGPGFQGANSGNGANPGSGDWSQYQDNFDPGSPVDVGNPEDYLGPSGGDYTSQGGGTYSGGEYTGPPDSGSTVGTEGDSGGYGGGSYGGGGYSGGGYYAKGGAIGGAAPGQFAGRVPPQASPSRGARTDDVQVPIHRAPGQPTGGHAHLNVDEFVIPQDVAKWKGQEFFQKLIQQSRANRLGAPAKPKSGPPGQRPPGGGAPPQMGQ